MQGPEPWTCTFTTAMRMLTNTRLVQMQTHVDMYAFLHGYTQTHAHIHQSPDGCTRFHVNTPTHVHADTHRDTHAHTYTCTEPGLQAEPAPAVTCTCGDTADGHHSCWRPHLAHRLRALGYLTSKVGNAGSGRVAQTCLFGLSEELSEPRIQSCSCFRDLPHAPW